MHAHTRLIAAAAFALVAMTALGSAQGGAAPAQTPPPAQPPAGRGAGRGADPAQAGQGGGGRRGGFYQYVRPPADADVLARGKGLYESNCPSAHSVDLRGTADGKNPNLLRSGTALSDKQGEQIGGAIARHTPAITLVKGDSDAIAEYIHSVHATMGGQGSPPGRNPTNVELNVLVGDPAAGQTVFAAACATCHSLTGDLKGIGSKYPDARALQNAWVQGTGGGGRFGGGGRGGGGAGNPVKITLADG